MTSVVTFRCSCGEEAIPGSLWTDKDTAAWHRVHDAHAAIAPVQRPSHTAYLLPINEALELRRSLAGCYHVGVVPGANGIAAVCVTERKNKLQTRARRVTTVREVP